MPARAGKPRRCGADALGPAWPHAALGISYRRMKAKEIHHRIYRVEQGFRLAIQRQTADVLAQLKSAGISSSNTPAGDVMVSGVSLGALLAALGFDGEPFKVIDRQHSILIIEPSDA